MGGLEGELHMVGGGGSFSLIGNFVPSLYPPSREKVLKINF